MADRELPGRGGRLPGRRAGRFRAPAALLEGLAALLLSAVAHAATLEGPECVVHFPEHARTEAERVVEMFPHQRAIAAEWLGIEARGRVRIHLVEDYAGLRAAVGDAPAWAVAVARRDDVLAFRLDRMGRTAATSIDLVLRHEVVHQVLGHLGGTPLPRWFEEGLCVFHAGVAYFEPDASLERLAAGRSLPAFGEADAYFRRDERSAAIAYRYGHAVVTRFIERFGEDLLRRLLVNLKAGMPFDDAFLETTGVPLATFEEQWRSAITPTLPLWLFVLLENLELVLLCAGALLVAGGYVHWRLRRERALRSMEPPGPGVP